MLEIIHPLLHLNFNYTCTCKNYVHAHTCILIIISPFSGGVVWRVKCNERKLVCAVGSRNGIEDTKLLVLDFDSPPASS